MGSSKNTLNTTPKKMGRLDKMIVFNVLIIVMILICVSLLMS
jgi:cell division protein FtsL